MPTRDQHGVLGTNYVLKYQEFPVKPTERQELGAEYYTVAVILLRLTETFILSSKKHSTEATVSPTGSVIANVVLNHWLKEFSECS